MYYATFYISKTPSFFTHDEKILYLHPYYIIVYHVGRLFVLKCLSKCLFFISTMSIINLVFFSQFQNIRDLKCETIYNFASTTWALVEILYYKHSDLCN